ncbi:nucleotidyltransferase domain protein [Actinomyces sp. Chiba101]|uniref:nucleotidyltransferase family protein n=1 Tax=Actinomyces TaxID=1654 RepID=UPI000974EEB8|nr:MULTISPECIES: nucleotidyltransferase family protein [Actinomyces]BAW92044.1 nucleotidyltransferase domain protein [Actinomyces sp. Chiba101]GAV95024.1 nucleotidyltransferase domain protein [Actinomyces denticolens]
MTTAFGESALGSLGSRLRRHREDVLEYLTGFHMSDVRVFGSVSRGTDGEASDIDLLVHVDRPLSLLTLAHAERGLQGLLGAPIDLVPDNAIRPDLRERILSEAVPL